MQKFIINYLKINNISDFSRFKLQDDGNGIYIKEWFYDINKPNLPSNEEILLSNLIDSKLEKLDNYHFNSQEIRQCKINNYFILQLDSTGRSLIQEQINFLVQKVKLGLVTEESATFEYFYNGGSIDITLTQLRQLYVAMLNIVNSNFQNYKTEINIIKNLSTIEEIESYDFTINYLKNQNISL